jgi:hypothetical protein
LSIERQGQVIEFDTPGKVTGYPIAVETSS